jgi:hypothetical protein
MTGLAILFNGRLEAQCPDLTLIVTDIAGFSMFSSTDPGTVTINNGIVPAATAVTLTTDFSPPQQGLQSASVGLSGLNIAFNGGDSFSLNLVNVDENPWIYQLVVVTDQGTFMSAAMSLVPDVGATFQAALGGVAGTISSAYFVVSGNVPQPDGDRTTEYDISSCDDTPVPTASSKVTSSRALSTARQTTQDVPVVLASETFSLIDIAGFSMLSSTDPGTVTINNGIVPAGTAVTLTTDFSPPQVGLQSASVGLSGLNIAFNGGDSFSLNLVNVDENPWIYQLVVVTDQGTFMSAAMSLVPDVGATFQAALGGVAGTISSAYFVVSGNVPQPDGDRTAEYDIMIEVAAVCDPAEACCDADGQYETGGTVCRAAADQCDAAEVCTGSSATCPADLGQPDGTTCDDANACTQTDECSSGVCTGSNPVICTALDECYDVGVCDPSTGDCSDPPKNAGETCGSPGDGSCVLQDTCDGSGSCVDNGFEDAGTACGDRAMTECTDPDSCDAGGVCLFNNVECGSVTTSGLCEFDEEPEKDGDQFRLAFSPDMQNWVSYKQNSTNPGQFYYNAIYDASTASDGVSFELVVPYPFVTQGATPLHVYDAELVPSNGSGCLDPQVPLMSAQTVIGLADWLQGDGYEVPDYLVCDQTLLGETGDCVITIDIPQAVIEATSGGWIYLNLHLDYGLKGPHVDANGDDEADRYDRAGFISEWGSSDALFNTDTNDGDVAIADCSVHSFAHAVDTVPAFGDEAENLNIFKQAAGAFGHASCAENGDPLMGFIQLRREDNYAVAYTSEIDVDGYYAAAFAHKGKPAYYYLAWCDDAACTTEYDATASFGLQSNGFVQVDLLDLDATAPRCDGSEANLDDIAPVYSSGKFKN